MRHWFYDHSVRPLDATAHSGRCNDHARRPVPADHCLRSRLAQVWTGPRATLYFRKIWRVRAVGNDGVLSYCDGRPHSLPVGHRTDISHGRHLRRAVSACPYPMARRFPTDDFGRAVDRPRVLAMEHARLWRRNRFGNAARSPWDIGLRESKALGAGRPSLRELKPLEPVQLFLDSALQILARAPRRGVDPAPFLHQQFAALAVGLQIDGGDDVFTHQNRQREIAEHPFFPGHIGFEAMAVAEKQFGALALNDERIERR